MNKKALIIIIILIVLLITLGIIAYKFIYLKNNNKEHYSETIENEYNQLNTNNIQYQENVTIEDLKEQTSISGNNEIYEIQEEYDGRKVLTVKANIKYKVAFAGMIKKTTPTFDELDEILEQKLPKFAGIWIEENSKDYILKLFNNSNNTNGKYYIDNEGYLKNNEKDNQTTFDSIIDSVINGDKQYILSLSSVCYIVDDVTGEIWDYNFENLDRYQTYEYFEDEDKCIIFINQNSYGQLTDSEIIDSIVNMF